MELTQRCLILVSVAAILSCSGAALATEGYFQNAYGARQKALAGAGVADSRDATATSLNPAGLVDVEDQLNVSASVFSPRRGFVGSGEPGLTPFGDIDSGRNYFLIPNLAYSQRIQDSSFVDVVGLTLYANGGLNTEYDAVPGSATCQALNSVPPVFGGPIGQGRGVFCNGHTGSDLNQAFLSAAFAKRFGNISVGLAPILAVQLLEFEGLQLFEPFSVAPNQVSNNGHDVSLGGGIRAGIEVSLSKRVRLGVAGNSRIWMSEFDDYRGLLAEKGDFDIPPSLQAGIAVDVTQRLTLMADYKRIWYSDVSSIHNPSTNILTASVEPAKLLGGANGAGFGWDDINIIKIGAEWRATDRLTLRAGYGHNEGPFSSRDVMVNILAPGIVQDHFAAGLKYEVAQNWDLELSGFYAPKESVSGGELAIPTPFGPIGNPKHGIDIEGHGGEVTLGVTYRFGGVAELK